MPETKATGLIGVPAEAAAPVQHVTVQQLLEDEPLHSQKTVLYLFRDPERGYIAFPDEIHLHCEHEKCGGVRRHTKKGDSEYSIGSSVYAFVTYVCINCTSRMKVFGLKAWWNGKRQPSGMCAKIYQEPPFGQPIPKRLFEIIGEGNREFFLQARRSIARGLGIGAYGYYRRIVENTKFDLVGSVLKVAEATNAAPAQIELLKKAQAERQFSKAMDTLRDVSAIPAALLIDGYNPLALLHDALSKGIHELTDGECLERAQESEIILCEIANRMQMAVTEHKTVKAALTSILKRKSVGENAAASKK